MKLNFYIQIALGIAITVLGIALIGYALKDRGQPDRRLVGAYAETGNGQAPKPCPAEHQGAVSMATLYTCIPR